MNFDSLSPVERMTAQGLLEEMKRKHPELAKKAAEEVLVRYVKVLWLTAGDSRVKVVVAVDRGDQEVCYCSLPLDQCQFEVTRVYHVAAHTAAVAEGGVGLRYGPALWADTFVVVFPEAALHKLTDIYYQ